MNENIQGREISTRPDVKMMTEKESGMNCYLLNSQNNMIGFYDLGGAIGDSEVVVEIVPEIETETELVKLASGVYSGAKVLEAGVVKGSYYIWSDNGSMPFSIEVVHSILSADGLGERPVGGVTVQVVNTLSNDPVDVVFNLTQENTMFPGERLIHRINVNSQVTGEKISIAFGGGRPSRFVLPFLGEHNTLGGLQGGSMGEYFHLNSTEYEKNLLNDGEGSALLNTFTEAAIRENLESGERLSDSLGKLMKWYSDLNPVAWSGNASDLTEDASNRLVTDSEKATWNGKLDQTGGVVTGTIDMSGNNITGLASAVNPTDAINKADLEAAISGIVDTPSNVNMAGRLVKEIEITEPTSSVVFDNLDADADGGYELIVESGVSEVNSKLRLFLNNDTVLSNYKRTYLQHEPNNDITAVQMNDPVIGATSPNSQNYIVANIGTNGYIKTSMVRSDAYHQENYINPIRSEIGFRTTVDNIYKMELQSEEANAIPVGTKIYLYRNKSGNGLPNLVREEVVSSATRSITFSGLDALTDGGYELTLDAVGGTSEILYYVYFNGDTTDTNYERVWYGASANSFGGDTGSTANIAVSQANSDGFYVAADISPTGMLVSNQLRTGNLSSFDISIHRKTPITNLTEINITSNADIPVGTRVALYRKKFSVVVAPELETHGANTTSDISVTNQVDESLSGIATTQSEVNMESKTKNIQQDAILYDHEVRLQKLEALVPIVYLPFNVETGYTDYGDNAGGMFVETEANMQISTDNPKFGSGSLWCSGAEYSCVKSNIPELGFGQQDFTVEFWCRGFSGGQSQTYSRIFAEYNNMYNFMGNNEDVGGRMFETYFSDLGELVSVDWVHYAVVRHGSNYTIYKNGAVLRQRTDFTTGLNWANLSIGGNSEGSSGFKGYIDDFAIWNYAKYTGEFTPPTEPVYTPTANDILRTRMKEMLAQ